MGFVIYMIVGLIATIFAWNKFYKYHIESYKDYAKDIKCMFVFFGLIIWPLYLINVWVNHKKEGN